MAAERRGGGGGVFKSLFPFVFGFLSSFDFLLESRGQHFRHFWASFSEVFFNNRTLDLFTIVKFFSSNL